MIDDDAAAGAMVERTAVRSLGVKDGQVQLRRQAEAERDEALASRQPLAWVVLEWCDDDSRVVVASELYPAQGLAEAAARDLTREDECGCRYTVAALAEEEAE
jgi:hypothetical protein